MLLDQPWAAPVAVAAPAALSLGQVDSILTSSLPSPQARDEPSLAEPALLTLVLQGGAPREPYDPVHIGALLVL